MISFFHACSSILSRSGFRVAKGPPCSHLYPSWRTSCNFSDVRTVNLEFLLTRLQGRCYSSKKSGKVSSVKPKTCSEPIMKDDKEAFFVVRKGDVIGVYKSLTDCQAQVGTSIFDHPVSVFEGCSMPKNTEKYLSSYGLKNALYSIRASELTEELFGTLVPCPIQPPNSISETSIEPLAKKRSQESLQSDCGQSSTFEFDGFIEPVAKKRSQEAPWSDYGQSCTLEFDGASRGNPGQAGAGAILRSEDGSLICRLREGLGVATNNVAEYRAFILGLKYALEKGFTSVRVRGDSKLVCMQIQGLWKVKNQNISTWYEEAKLLKDKFLSFQINHILRDLNSEADAQANLGVNLAEGQIQEEIGQ